MLTHFISNHFRIPMKDNGGKVILALLAGASAGIVAGLLLAPETGDDTRSSIGKSLGKLGEDLNKLVQDGLAKLNDLKGEATSDDTADRSGAEEALADLGSDQSAPAKPSAPSATSTQGSTAGGAATATSSQGGATDTGSFGKGGSGVGS